MKSNFFRRIVLPGLMFQSVVIGGAYATGRELVEFFLSVGPFNGLLGILVATVGFSVIIALTLELARKTRSYTYRRFFQQLLGRRWFLYEIAYASIALVALGVIGSASTELAREHLNIDGVYGAVALMSLIAALVFGGTGLIERVLSSWSAVLYIMYAFFVVLYLVKYGAQVAANFETLPNEGPWITESIRYVGYSIVVVPVILFSARHLESRSDSLLAGMLAGPIAMIPGMFAYLCMVGAYPEILNAPVPMDFMMQKLNVTWLQILFYVVVFGTFVETGSALLHAVNERVAEIFNEHEKHLARWVRPLIAFSACTIAILLAEKVGIIELIASGYGTLAWALIVIYLLPLFTIGVWKIWFEDSPAKLAKGNKSISTP